MSKTKADKPAEIAINLSTQSHTNATKSLFAALGKGDVNLVDTSIKAGADLNAKTPLGFTALHIAVIKRQSAIIKALINAGADVDAVNKRGNTPLHFAAENVLFNAFHANYNAVNDEGYNFRNYSLQPLSSTRYASNARITDKIANLYEATSLLLMAGANPNIAGARGTTPLYLAAQEGHHGIVEALIWAGADFKIRVYDYSDGNCGFSTPSRTPREVAVSSGVVVILKEAEDFPLKLKTQLAEECEKRKLKKSTAITFSKQQSAAQSQTATASHGSAAAPAVASTETPKVASSETSKAETNNQVSTNKP